MWSNQWGRTGSRYWSDSYSQVIVEGFEERGGILKLKEQQQQGTCDHQLLCGTPCVALADTPGQLDGAPSRAPAACANTVVLCCRASANMPQVMRMQRRKSATRRG
jgi:hypothetical protein